MPAPLKELRELCHSLYLQGLKREIIINRTGVGASTLDKWVNRGKWVAVRDKSNELVGREIAEAQSQRVKSIIGDRLEQLAKSAANTKTPRGINGIRDHAETLNSIVGPASKVFAWSEANNANAFLTGIVTGLVGQTIRPDQSSTTPGPVIDIPNNDEDKATSDPDHS